MTSRVFPRGVAPHRGATGAGCRRGRGRTVWPRVTCRQRYPLSAADPTPPVSVRDAAIYRGRVCTLEVLPRILGVKDRAVAARNLDRCSDGLEDGFQLPH